MLFIIFSASLNGSYYLIHDGESVVLTYCYMDNISECGGGGWTLAMKIDGKKVSFKL